MAAAAAAAGGGSSIAISSFPSSSSYFSHTSTTANNTKPKATAIAITTPSSHHSLPKILGRLVASRHRIACSAVQESSTPSVATEAKEATEAKAAAPAKPKPPAKAPAKPLAQLMEEDVIPSLKTTLEAQQDIVDLQLSFQDNTLEGSFLKKDIPYFFWAFFPDGLAGAKGFSLSSYGTGASTVEPFLVDEKKITAKHVVFWVQKRLAAQGIIPVWRD